VKKVGIMEFGIKFQLVSAICIFANVVQSSKIKTPNLSHHPVLLVVSFDGFRFDYLEKVDLPAFEAIRSEGVSVPYMKPQFPTKTFVNHQSIATGLFPDFHGITDTTLYDPVHHKILSGFGNDPDFWVYRPDVIPFWVSELLLFFVTK
jgi:predicted AlkP superfamily pyrophosphatase or phosphodiesterase